MHEELKKNTLYVESKIIEEQRIILEDIPQRENAIAQGYFPVVNPSLMDNMNLENPLIAGLPFTNTYYCNEGYGLIKYKSDRFGFRNDDNLWEKNPRRLMIGDSFVHGACVPEGSTLPEKLSLILGENVLNLGMSGSEPSHYLTFANLFIPFLNPTVVYLNFYPNDNGVNNISSIEQKYVVEKKPIFSDGNLEFLNIEIFKSEGRKVIDILNRKEKVEYLSFTRKAHQAILRHSKLPLLRNLVFQHTSGFEDTERVIRSVTSICLINDCELVVSFIPNSKYHRPDSRADGYGDKIKYLTNELGLDFVDGRDILNRDKDSYDFAVKGLHLSPEGYGKMAKLLATETQFVD